MTTKHVRRFQRAAAVAVIGLMQACGSSGPTPQLIDARRAYDQAQMSPGARLAPDHLLTAHEALQAAEMAHKEDPGSTREAHLAYLAERKSQQALALGKIAQAKQSEASSKSEYVSKLEQGSATAGKERAAREQAEREKKAAE